GERAVAAGSAMAEVQPTWGIRRTSAPTAEGGTGADDACRCAPPRRPASLPTEEQRRDDRAEDDGEAETELLRRIDGDTDPRSGDRIDGGAERQHSADLCDRCRQGPSSSEHAAGRSQSEEADESDRDG